MRKEDLQFTFPEELVATSPAKPSRVMWFEAGEPTEIALADLLSRVPTGDLWIINETKVLKRRVFAGELEILFIKEISPSRWEVLFPSKNLKIGDEIELPEGRRFRLAQKGRPQVVDVIGELKTDYFERWGEVPLPPYIQKARQARHAQTEDDSWYQTFWAENPGSLAAPTASLHFQREHFEALRARGVEIAPVTLHVGLGTFLPVTTENLNDHSMHFEEAEIPRATWDKIQAVKARGGRVWAVGTTVARTLESVAPGLLREESTGFRGETNLFILPGFEWRVVDRLLTNFHQPESTLLALVAAFAGLQDVKNAYAWAMQRKFRLFSYGDLSAWIK